MSLSVFAAAREAPDHAAVVTDRETLTWAELADRVRAAVEALRARGLDGPDPVALVAANDLPTFEAIHALLALGAPALLLHPRITAPERTRLLEAAGVDAPHDPRGRGVRRESSSDPASPPDDERPLAIVHTSGSAGVPKGVILSRRAFVASARASAANLGWRPDDRWLLPLPMAHVGGLSIVTRCLLARRTAVLAPGTDPRSLAESIGRHRVTLASLVPTVLKRLLDLDPPAEPPGHLRAVLLGGAPASPALLARAADRRWPVLTTYGLTEACSQVTTQRYGTENRGEAGSGPPLPGVELRIGDDDAIQVRGPTLLSGYVGAPDGPPLLPGGWLDTGDRGRLDARGNLHVLGRRSDRIVTGGENVDPAEVEQALESLPGVRAACVFGVPDEEWGEVVCAAVVLATGPEAGAAGAASGGAASATGGTGRADLEAAIRDLRGRLAPFKLPRRLAVLDALPRNPTGKVDREATARRAAARLRPL